MNYLSVSVCVWVCERERERERERESGYNIDKVCAKSERVNECMFEWTLFLCDTDMYC